MQQRKGPFTNPGLYRLQCGDEVGPEERGVIVALIERDPCYRPFAGRGSRHPFRQQRSLAETGWPGDEGQLALRPLFQAVDQSWTRYQTGTPLWDIKLGLK